MLRPAATVCAAVLLFASVESLPAHGQTAPDLGATVDGLLESGRQLNPMLRAAVLDTAAASAKADAAGSLDDPMVTDNYQYYRSGSLFSMHFVTVTQAFPLWGKRDLRRQAALAEMDAAKGRERAARDQLDEQIKVAFTQYYAAARAIAVSREVITVSRQMQQAAAALYGQGSGDQADIIQAMSEVTTAEADIARLQGDREAARSRLNALVARAPDAPLAQPQRLRPLPSFAPNVAVLLDRARVNNPTVYTSLADIESARSQSRLADRAWYPDITVGGGPVVQTNGPTGFNITVGLSIPLQQGAKAAGQREAAARLSAAQQRLDSTMLDIQSALGDALARLTAARRTEDLLRRSAVPQVRAAYQSAIASYAQGRGNIATTLTAEHRVHDVELTLLRTQIDAQVALAAIERLIGGDL